MTHVMILKCEHRTPGDNGKYENCPGSVSWWPLLTCTGGSWWLREAVNRVEKADFKSNLVNLYLIPSQRFYFISLLFLFDKTKTGLQSLNLLLLLNPTPQPSLHKAGWIKGYRWVGRTMMTGVFSLLFRK